VLVTAGTAPAVIAITVPVTPWTVLSVAAWATGPAAATGPAVAMGCATATTASTV
jgi:hypothetical protein